MSMINRLSFAVAIATLLAPAAGAQGAAAPATPKPPAAPKPAAPPAAPTQWTFPTPEAAAWALVRAAEEYDIETLTAILGPDGVDLVVTSDQVQDRQHDSAFAALARQQARIVRDPAKKTATLNVGPDDWPMPIPIVEKNGRWRFDTLAGRKEVLNRRVGENELDAIEACRGFVDAQGEYASEKHGGASVNQYAQRIISTPGKQDGLAWQDADGTWQGPLGEELAQAIAEGYTDKSQPYHGYYYKVLKGQSPAAPLGQMDFVVQGLMIGGFALVAAPADYAISGVKTFIVSHQGIVYEKDLGPTSLDRFRAMERYNPDSTWKPVQEP
jgi:hypothetical protein